MGISINYFRSNLYGCECKVMEKMMDKYEPFIDKMFNDLNDDL